MISNKIVELIKRILFLADKAEIDIMFIGGIAVSAWAVPRATYDLDAVVQISEKKLPSFLSLCEKYGFIYDKKKPVKRIQNLSFITLTAGGKDTGFIYVDLFLARGKYFQGAIRRKKTINIFKTAVPVISPEDLILYKLIAGRGRDIEDVYEILVTRKSGIDMDYLKKWAEELGIPHKLQDVLQSFIGRRAEEK
jgi:hypothetical protein